MTLLVVGVLFLIGLAWWELRRPHQARGSNLPRPMPEPLERPSERMADWDMSTPAMSRNRSADLELPRISARDPEEELPVVEVAPAEFAELEAQAEPPRPHSSRQQSLELNEDFSEDFVADLAHQPVAHGAAPVVDEFAADFSEAVAGEAELLAPADPTAHAPATADMDGLLAEVGAHQIPDPPISDLEVAPTAALPAVAAPVMPEIEAVAAAAPAAPEPLPDAEPAGVVVEWPEPEASQVLAVRLVSVGEKFSGRAVRMALAAEGFELGKFSIFHKPAADGRALLSVASLTKPGTFDSQSMDMQRYTGLNLFTVLPGPLPGPAAVDELLGCAQILAQRLRAAMQNEKGEPLSPLRAAALREQAAAPPT